MTELEFLAEVLTRSIAKHGEQPLTNQWLLNCINMAIANKRRADERHEEFLDNLVAEFDRLND